MAYNWDRFVQDKEKVVTVAPIKVKNSVAMYQDAKSAAFFAMGMAIKKKEPVILLIPGEYLANVYTAMTEAWFQKAEIIIYAFYRNVSDINTSWADRCAKTITIHIDEYETCEDKIKAYYHKHEPVLINIAGINLQQERVDYSTIISAISSTDKDAKFILYNSKNQSDMNNIKTKYKYGILSKYVGLSVAKKVGYLLCDTECMLVDINIFRTRYANGNMKIAVLDDGKLKDNQIDQWITSNGWKCRRVEKIDGESANWLKEQSMQAVLIIEGEM